MALYFIKGKIYVEKFENLCKKEQIKPKQMVFIFPGNPLHHRLNITLFSMKQGGGLAKVAENLGRLDYPTLSLPTTSMSNWRRNLQVKKITQGAVADLYRVSGADYHLLLPVRPHKNKDYFDQVLQMTDEPLEPSFWGGIETEPNKPLANYYVIEINKLSQFLSHNREQQYEKARNHITEPFMAAFVEGYRMKPTDPWFKHQPK